MELKAYFSNIHKVIIEHLEQTKFEIIAAVAWFTDRDIFEVLCKKTQSGVRVSVALIGDDTNQGRGRLDFQRLEALGGQIIFLPPGTRDQPTMHHKYCVIDRRIVITGSYNWSKKARINDENITVVTDAEDFASSYLDEFRALIVRTGCGASDIAAKDLARRRLEIIRNLILLREHEGITSHLRELRSLTAALHISEILAALESGRYQVAIEMIDAYLFQVTALVTAEDADLPRLRLQLKTLELRLESLTNEKAELERCLINFNRCHDAILGDVIYRILKARAELARLIASEKASSTERLEADTAAHNAERVYEDYFRQYEELQRAEPLIKLDEKSEWELKTLFRKSCSLCHPDKVNKDKKEVAHEIFVELREAYRCNDVPRVRGIYEKLKSGNFNEIGSSALRKTEELRVTIKDLELKLNQVLGELRALQESDGARLMSTAGATEVEWMIYFERQQLALEKEAARIVSQIQAAQTEEIRQQ